MQKDKELLQHEMLESIRNGGAWFTTWKDKFIKIEYSKADDCYFARECFKVEGGLEGGAYTFGTDWFDINFHGRNIDIYVDPASFRRWPVSYDAVRGTFYDSEECIGMAERVLRFCKLADREALAGGLDPYKISGANFSGIIQLEDDK